MKSIPKGLWILAVLIPLFELYYYVRPILSGYESPYGSPFALSLWAFIVWFHVLLSIIVIISVTYGFYKARNWARLYTLFYFCYSSFWNLYLLFVERVWPYERYIWLIFYVIVIVYLLMSHVKEYFGIPVKSD